MSKKPIDYFYDICAIPHGTGNEKALSDFIVKFAKDLGFWVRQDESFNVIVKKPGTPGYEKAPVVMLQGHIDMVCEKNEGTKHDFEKEGIKTIIEGDFIRADGTTLGADDGSAIAIMLCILDSKDVPHPPIEAIFTTGEEVGLRGVMAMRTDDLEGRILINMDGVDGGQFCASSAGGIRNSVTVPVTRTDISGLEYYKLELDGLKGGHSGIDIHTERGNSNILLCRAINTLSEQHEIYISSITGGDKDNAIPREACAVFAVKAGNFAKVESTVNGLDKTYKSEYRVSDPDVSLHIQKYNGNGSVMDTESAKKVIAAVLAIPSGVLSKSMDVEGLTETSNNIGVIRTSDDSVKIMCFIRSAVVSRKYFAFDRIKAIGALTGASVALTVDTAPWEFDPDSYIRKLYVDTYEDLYGKAEICAIHGGVECGVFIEKMGKIDCVSYGPTIFDVHTPDERMSLSSFDRAYELHKAVLKKIK